MIAEDAATRAQHKRDEVLIKEGKKYPLKSGPCSHSWCEGTRPVSWRGVPVQVCGNWQLCPCSCHDRVTRLFQLADSPREVMLNPEYRRPERTFYMPVFGVDYGLSSALLDAGAETLDGVKRAPLVPREPGTFAPTPSGRAARGELESQVYEVVGEWMIQPEGLCTPQFVSDEIARVQHVAPPSTGAISAVFDRWVAYGYAVTAKKPVRLVGLTDEGKTSGLEFLKLQFKRTRRVTR